MAARNETSTRDFGGTLRQGFQDKSQAFKIINQSSLNSIYYDRMVISYDINENPIVVLLYQDTINSIFNVATVADVAGSLNSDYFLLDSALGLNLYYVWYNVNGAGVDPAIPNRQGIEVSVATNATAANVAYETTVRINLIGFIDFDCRYNPNTNLGLNAFNITLKRNGITTPPNAATSGFTITTAQIGESELVQVNNIVYDVNENPINVYRYRRDA